ncbi:MAG TPA: long-chain fatty acid--CoA ligase [Bacteroidales bacterium]|jgi:long-chain acyl-CoA synthetase|nr:long-chain fatty acid--CoA ligase [Bacteroidales bacterium]
MDLLRIFDILDHMMSICPEKDDILAFKEKGSWVKYSVRDYLELVENTSYGLIDCGLRKGDMVATISNNRPEWNIMDMALSQVGVIHVPIYPTISEEDYSYILGNCEPKLLFVSDRSLHDKLKPITEKIKSIRDIYSYNEVEGVKNWKEILNHGTQNAEKYNKILGKIRKSITGEDIATLIYTSGTTGNPKGVMLSHRNLMSNVHSISQTYSFNHTHRTLSFLPISHVFERTINYYFQSIGASIYYSENLGTIAENLKEVSPHVFISVPRLLERTYDKIISKGRELHGIKKQIFFWAVNLGMQYKIPDTNSSIYKIQLKIADKLVFRKWREALGGKVQLIVAGGAALQPRLCVIFNAAGVPVAEGYGMTEASPVISANRLPSTGDIRIGTVGPPVPDVEVRIAHDGEILCKGPNVMSGYYKEPELTKEVIDDEGWLHTGDIGIMLENRYLKITDRKKEMFKLSSGKYIAPQVIENKLKESNFIEQVMVIGENQKFASAIISPDFNFLHNWAMRHGIEFRDNAELIQIPGVIARYQRVVNEMNKQLGQTEQIKRFRLVQEEWSQNTGELSPTLKLKRKFLVTRYSLLIEEIFSVQKGDLGE